MKRGLSLALLTLSLTGCMHSIYNPFEPGDYSLQSNRSLKNEDILEDIIVINESEIAAANLAQSKSRNTKVRKFAAYLKQAHTQNLNQANRLSRQIGTPNANAQSSRLENHGQEELGFLQSQAGTAFDKAYMKAMVHDHGTALRIIDQDIANSTNPKLTKFLKDTRMHVQAHLRKAQNIQKEEGLY